LAGETGCALHVVHVSCARGIGLIMAARRRGLNVSCETCPHYLTLTAEDLERIGATAKCAPPLRSEREQEELWGLLLAGEIDTVGSDHSPSPLAMKQGADFFKVWGGISSVQLTLPLLLGKVLGDGEERPGVEQNSRNLQTLTRVLSKRVARHFKLPPTKGRLVVGSDADLALVDLRQTFEVRKEDLLYRHQQTPYVGRQLRGRVVRTMVRGQTVFQDGKIVGKPLGQLVKPIK
jgi:allantoinase